MTFNRGETRRKGIEVIHAEPCVLEIDGKRVKLGNNSEPQQELGAIQTDAGFYVSASVKSTLPRQQREGYLHFIIDRHYTDVEGVQAAMQLAMDSMPQWCNNYKVSLVDWKVTTLAQPQEWKKELTKHTPQGGFFADRALKQMWYESYMNPSGTFPVPVIITNKSKLPTIEDNYRDWQFTFPDNHWLYVIRAEGGVTAHNLWSMTTTATDCVIHPTQEVSAYPTLPGDCYYLSSTNRASLIPARTMI